jgi:uncharacterized repeat protein (TIGR02543 family)
MIKDLRWKRKVVKALVFSIFVTTFSSMAILPAQAAAPTIETTYGLSTYSHRSWVTSSDTTTVMFGTNLRDVTSVTVGGSAVVFETTTAGTSIKLTVPAGTAGPKDVVITNASGSATLIGGFVHYTTLTPACGTSGTFTITNNNINRNTDCRGSVDVPEGVVGIYGPAFQSGYIVGTVKLPSTLKTIGTGAFQYSTVNAVIPRGVTSLDGAFYLSYASSITFETPTSATSLTQTFRTMANLSSIVVPEGITSIGYLAFATAPKLRKISLPSTITSINVQAFQDAALTCVANPGNNSFVNAATYSPQPVNFPASGNAFASTAPIIVSDIADCPNEPTITSISTTSGPTTGGTSLVITGTNLTGTRGVKIGTFNATIETVTSTSVAIKTAAGTGTALPIHLVATGGWLSTASPITYSYNPPPTITSLNITSGVTAGGSSVIITGTNLLNATSVTVGGVSATLGANTQTTQAITTPSTTVGAKDIVVTTPSGSVTSNGAFTYYTTLTPSCGTSGTFTIANNSVTGHTSCTGTVAVPEGVTSIAAAAANGSGFRGASISGVVTLPSTLKTIGGYAFRDTGAISVVIPKSVTSLGAEFAFQFSGITSVTFETPTSLTQLPKGTFSPTTSLTSVVVPEGITTLGDGVFGGNVRNVSLPGTINSMAAGSLTNGNLVCVANPGNSATVTSAVSLMPNVPPAGWPGVGNEFTRVAVKLVSNISDCPSGNPTITSISTTSGTTAGGTSLEISGTNLTGTRGVKIGTFDATIETVTATSVWIKTPAGTGSNLAVHLVADGGWVSSTSPRVFSYVSPPTITLLSVTEGPVAGGTSTVITGTNLSSATSVTIGGVAASRNSNTATSLTITTPSGTSGAKDVVVTTAAGSVTAVNAYRYAGVPTISSLSVVSGPLAGGATTVIIGTNLESATAVTVGGANATRVTNTATALTITTPSGTVGAKNVVVTTAGGTVTVTNAYTYVAAPTITSLSVTSGSTVGGTVLVIAGTNMSNTTGVTVGGVPATFETNTSTSITITTPASVTDGLKSVILTTAGGPAPLNNSFNYKFPIVYNGNTNTGGSVPSTVLRNTNETLTVSANSGNLVKSGYTFSGWNRLADGTGTNYSAGVDSFTVTGSTNLFAKWIANNYTVTYRADSATAGTVPTDATNYNIGNSVALRGNTGALLRTGYSFVGWTAAADGSGIVLNSGETFTTGVANMTFHAKWSANTYTITYRANGGTGSPTRATDSYTTGGTAVTLSAGGTLARTGFDFAGWSTTADGSLIVGTYTTTTNIDLYAVWTLKSIAITFDKGAASAYTFTSFPANRSANFGSKITLNDVIDSSVTIGGAGYAFMGWSDGTSTYSSGSTYLMGATAPTFTALWAKLYAVRYTFNGGTAAGGSSAVDSECLQADNTCINAQVITSNPAPSRAGYQFAGWADQNGLSVPTADSFTVGASRYLIYANWTPVNYSISYAANSGSSVPSSFTKQIGETFTVTSETTRTGYTFAGWSDGTNTYGASSTYYVSSAAVVLTAQWTPRTYSIRYDWNGGTGSSTNPDSFTTGNTPVTLPLVGDHIKDGYSFNGWAASRDGLLITGGYSPTQDVTLYAIWGSGSYTVTFNATGGTVSPSTATVSNGTSLSLPTPTRTSYQFDGWIDDLTTPVTEITGATYTPTASRTLKARWIQNSLYRVGPYTDFGSITVTNGIGGSFSANNATSSVTVTYPINALPAGTIIRGYLVTDPATATPSGVIPIVHNPVIAMVLAWQAPDGTVPSTDTGTALSLTITNDTIKQGAKIYNVLAGVSTFVGTATSDGTITVPITDDPLIVVVISKPDEPTSVVATTGEDAKSVVSWSAPTVDGGSPITGYTATSSGGQSCVTVTTTCTVTSLANGTAYTFTVRATNAIGTGVASLASSPITPSGPTTGGGNAPSESAPVSVPKAISTVDTATVQANLNSEKKAVREALQVKVAKEQKTYLDLFASLTSIATTDASTSILIPNEKLGASLNAKTETISSSQSANLKLTARNISLSSAVIEEFKSRAKITVTTTGISVTPVAGFTGTLVVPVVGLVDGVETVVLNKVVVNPAPPVAQSFGPTSIKQSTIAWTPSTSQTVGYLVAVNGKKVCQTSGNSCPLAELIGPKSVVTITALGNDQTVSIPVVIPYSANAPIPALKVNFSLGSSVLSPAQKREIRSISQVINTQGFTRLVVNGFTDSRGSVALNKKLSEARAKSVAVFMRTLLPNISIKASAFGPAKPVASNDSKSGQAQNRRTEIATW